MLGMDEATQKRAEEAFATQVHDTLVGRQYALARVWFLAGFKLADDQANASKA